MREVILETPNELDLTIGELQAIAEDVRTQDPALRVLVGRQQQRGAGVTFWDVVHFWVPDPDFFRDAVYGYILARLQEAMKERRKGPHQGDRPSSVIVHLPDGTVVETIELSGKASKRSEPLPGTARPRPDIVESGEPPGG